MGGEDPLCRLSLGHRVKTDLDRVERAHHDKGHLLGDPFVQLLECKTIADEMSVAGGCAGTQSTPKGVPLR